MHVDIAHGNLFEAARDQALLTVRVIEKLLSLAPRESDWERLADAAVDDADLAGLYRYVATEGREGAENVATSIAGALEARWRDETAAALAAEFAPTGLSIESFMPLANGLLETCRATAKQQIGFWPAPAAAAALAAQTTAFTVRGDTWHKVFWCKGGKLHRDPQLGPATHLSEPRGDRFEYWTAGLLHRDWREGPAVIDTNFADNGTFYEAYWMHGKEHRPVAEGPAIYEIDAGNRERLRVYLVHGCHISGPEGWMARYYHQDIDRICEAYFHEGKPHRDWCDGPAVVERSPDGQYVDRKYFYNGELHRPVGHGPAIEGEGPGGIVVHAYYEKGVRHRPWQDGPAEWVGFGNGAYWETYMEHGEEHRPAEQGPAYTYCDKENAALVVHYAERGRRHRDPSHGPAFSECWGGATVHEEFWLSGKKLSERDRPASAAQTPRDVLVPE